LGTLRHLVSAAVDLLVDPVASTRAAPIVVCPGVHRAQWSRVDLGGVVIEMGDCSVPVGARGDILPAGRTVLTSLDRASGHRSGGAPSPVPYRYGGATEVGDLTASHAAVGILSVSTDALEGTATTLGVDIDRPRCDEVRVVARVDWVRLHGLLDESMVVARSSPVAALAPRLSCSLRGCLLDIIVRTFDRTRASQQIAPRHLNSMRITRLCEDHAEMTHYQDVSLASLCAAAGMSERRVREAFYECYGMSPTAVLRIAALHRVRRSLLRGTPTRDAVSRAATDSGFWHLSRFAGQYRALFDESPSATLSHRSSPVAG